MLFVQGCQSKPCWSRGSCLQVTICRAGLGLDVPCQVQHLCGAQAQWMGESLLHTEAWQQTTAGFEIQLWDSYQGKRSFSDNWQVLPAPGPVRLYQGTSVRLPHNRELILSIVPASLFAHLHLISVSLLSWSDFQQAQGAHKLSEHLLPPSLSTLPKL